VRIIPVMDILNEKVVNAVKGKRSEYQQLRSKLVNSSNPIIVASAFKFLGFEELYVADLDAIVKKSENISIIEQIVVRTGLKLLVDAGVEDSRKVGKLLESGVSNVIVGTETLSDLAFLEQILDVYGNEKIIVSLDLMNRKVLSKSESLKSKDALAAASEIVDMGVKKIILLDLARVGSGQGVDLELIKEMGSTLRSKILVGGGVRDLTDLLFLKDLGVNGALIATALHTGKISMEEIRRIEA
jgi:phosphoribosylformimino-5-aminoimidazole carboxamide ribotide isomerase